MSTDPFVHDDAAYVLGALSADERAAFEAHLGVCAACRARVYEVGDLPAALAAVAPDDLSGSTAADRLPDTLLPGLLHAAQAARRRRFMVLGAFASVAAACLVALVVVLWPPSSGPAGPAPRAFRALVSTPVQATARLTAKEWGTSIDLHCQYGSGLVGRAYEYGLVIYDTKGDKEFYGDWHVPVDQPFDGTTITALPITQISKLQIVMPDGTPILQLRV